MRSRTRLKIGSEEEGLQKLERSVAPPAFVCHMFRRPPSTSRANSRSQDAADTHGIDHTRTTHRFRVASSWSLFAHKYSAKIVIRPVDGNANKHPSKWSIPRSNRWSRWEDAYAGDLFTGHGLDHDFVALQPPHVVTTFTANELLFLPPCTRIHALPATVSAPACPAEL